MHFCKNDVVSNKLLILKKNRFQRQGRPKRMEILSELRSKTDYFCQMLYCSVFIYSQAIQSIQVAIIYIKMTTSIRSSLKTRHFWAT